MITEVLWNLRKSRVLFRTVLMIGLLQSLTVPALAVAGTEFSAKLVETRTYIEGDERKGYFQLQNQGDLPFLLLASVVEPNEDGGEGERSSDFLVSPPVTKVSPMGRADLSVMRLSEALPKDRETLRYLKVSFMPSQTVDSKEASLMESVNLFISVFYRPQSIVADHAVADGCRRLLLIREGTKASLMNPTPYWLILPQLLIDGRPEDHGDRAVRIAPFAYFVLERDGQKIEYCCRQENGLSTEMMSLP